MHQPPPAEEPFQGTERFAPLRRLGSGGMGVVYEALDRERGARVALKTLRTFTADALLRFKHEFRALQDIQHENLISLGELIEHEGQWFFTMELVDGVDFLRWVRPDLELARATTAQGVETAEPDTVELSRPRQAEESAAPAGRRVAPLDVARLRAALGQLARGLFALHARRRVHCDLKPSNILVTRDGRVVVLDFGLVIDADRIADAEPTRDSVVGTISFMAPEQAARAAVGPEADWYAVGVILYLALTGRVPFQGPAADVLERKQLVDPPPPSSLFGDIPVDLDRLCVELLRIDPAARPSGREVLSRLHVADPELRDVDAPVFVGRTTELRALDDAYAAVQGGRGVTVYIHGESGIGKTSLVRRFTEELAAREPQILVLAGRCFEREAVPYKAFDGIIDELTRWVDRLPRDEVASLLPRKPWLLKQLFPQLGRVPLVDDARRPSVALAAQEQRKQAFAAVRELLGRLADRRPLVLVIDDLQWADADSLALLANVMHTPDEPALLLLATVRSDTAEAPAATATHDGDLRHLHLSGLRPEEARRFASVLLSRRPQVGSDRASEIAAETAGHPLFIGELASGSSAPSLEQALWQRIGALDEQARALLELVAVSATPIRQRTAAVAMQIGFDQLGSRVAALRGEHLIRTHGARVADAIEAYHDRVRGAVLTRLTPERLRERHRQLAEALQREVLGANKSDLEAIAVHWRAAGERTVAGRFAALAAEEAARALAFDRAARLYRMALELEASDPGEAYRLQRALGDALAGAGRGGEAARAFLDAATFAGAGDAHELRRRAAEHLLFSGRVDEGVATLRSVLAEVGLPLPATPRRAVMGLLWHRLRIRLGGDRYRVVDVNQIPPDHLRRVDTCHAAALGLGLVDMVPGAEFQARHFLMVRRGCDAYRLTRALAAEATVAAATGAGGVRRVDALVQETAKMAERSGAPVALGWAAGAAGFTAFQRGGWRRASEQLLRADAIFRECPNVAWELATVQSHLLFTFSFLGRFGEAGVHGREWLREARERGDLYASTMIRLAFTSVYLAENDPATGRREAEDALEGWSHLGFHLQHFHAMHARARCALYTGDPAGARAILDETRAALEGSMLLRFQITRLTTLNTRTQVMLASAAAATGDERKQYLGRAHASARKILRERMAWSTPIAQLYQASLAMLEGDAARSLALLVEAERGAVAADMTLYAAVAQRRRGQLTGGSEGAALIADADARVRAGGVVDPERFAELYAAGFPA
ncbi:MAG: Serine/threonine-protein kinase PknA [Myxococcales bacterium]|nr:Serine/threonine-protein kinase PknA [Myxococcales bacterium]